MKLSKTTYRVIKRSAYLLAALYIMASCSTTKNLPEGEVLYTGYKTQFTNKSNTEDGETALSEIDAAIAKTPSTKMFGFIPFPFRLWVYNDFVKYKKGFGRFIFNRFACDPVYISTVNPDIRAKIATNLLYDYGYFNGNVTSETVVDKKNERKAGIIYNINMGTPYVIDTLAYVGFDPHIEMVMNRAKRRSYVKPGDQFNVPNLDSERTRVSTLLRNIGYYNFRTDYITYQADTFKTAGKVDLRMVPVAGLPEAAQKRYYVGGTSVYLYGRNGGRPNDSINYRGMNIYYHDKLEVKPSMLYRWINYQAYVKNDSIRRFHDRKLYSQYKQERIQEKLAKTGIFSYMNLQYTPKDTTATCDTLNLVLQAALSKPLDAELEFNVVTKSTDQTGPGAAFSLTRNNVFGGGESWNLKLNGSYEWQTGKSKKGSIFNSWEMGVESSLTFPRVVFPQFRGREYDFPATTTFKLYADQLNRAKYYKLLSFGGNVTYDFQRSTTSKYSISPFQLTFNVVQHRSEEFMDLAEKNPALYISLENQFIPAMSFSYTYDNSTVKGVKNPTWWQVSASEAGNILSCGYAVFGKRFNERDKNMMGSSFAQYVKLQGEYRYLFNINPDNAVATRVAAGVICSYGNKLIAPYSEQFYIGGANSVRAFTVRGVGPGGTIPQEGSYGYLDQTGTMRLEANAEWRFRLFDDLWGATFLDAGNVWLLRYDEARPEGQFRLKTFAKQIALGTGVGIRYDMDFLVFRLDVGVPLHDPYKTGKSGYYNVEGKFMKQLAVHFAIGYPF
jgi:outer membrane protein assembly factor BamA